MTLQKLKSLKQDSHHIMNCNFNLLFAWPWIIDVQANNIDSQLDATITVY